MNQKALTRVGPAIFLPLVFLLLAFAWPSAPLPAQELAHRWLYLQQSLQVKENLPPLEAVLRRAKAAGYNGVVLADFKLNILDRVPPHYFENAARFKQVCDELGLEIIPCVAPFGYSEGLLAHDPNLAAGLPVVDQPVVASSTGIDVPHPERNYVRGDFELSDNHVFAEWDSQDEPGIATFADTAIKHGGNASLRIEAPAGSIANRRMTRQVLTRPWTPFHASCWIRTDGFTAAGNVRMFAIGAGGRVLSYTSLGVKPTQDWTQHHVLFNSLDADAVRFYIGVWNGAGGRLWLDDALLAEAAFINLVRRPDAPLTLVAEKDQVQYQEGADYAIVRNPERLLGGDSFDRWHVPVAVSIVPGGRIGEGERLIARYAHTATFYDGQVCASLAAPEALALVEDQVRRVNDLFHPRTYFLSHDEIRLAGWTEAERAGGQTPGQLLAENVRRCVAVVRQVQPEARLAIWSDMFDPSHNAVNNFYLVRGDLAGSWEGLPRDMLVVNWNRGKAAQSLPFFAERGHGQVLAGYYDAAPERIREWLTIGQPTGSIRGAMYTTWRRNYDDLERFAAAAWGR
jgi:hypothetical protein